MTFWDLYSDFFHEDIGLVFVHTYSVRRKWRKSVFQTETIQESKYRPIFSVFSVKNRNCEVVFFIMRQESIHLIGQYVHIVLVLHIFMESIGASESYVPFQSSSSGEECYLHSEM